MPDFSQLKTSKKDVVEYRMYDVQGEPTLLVKHCGESNKPYFNEKLKTAEKHRQRRARITPEMIKELRDRDRETFPKFVITGWRDVVDATGAQVPFSRENCEAFLRAMDDDLFDDLRSFCENPSNFRETVDTSVAAGNSQTA